MRYDKLFNLLAATIESACEAGGFDGLTVLQAKGMCHYLTGKSRKWWLDNEPKTEEEA